MPTTPNLARQTVQLISFPKTYGRAWPKRWRRCARKPRPGRTVKSCGNFGKSSIVSPLVASHGETAGEGQDHLLRRVWLRATGFSAGRSTHEDLCTQPLID